MKFKEIEKEPEFTLMLSLSEAIDLWRIVSVAKQGGNPNANKFVDALYDFADHSNRYNDYLK